VTAGNALACAASAAIMDVFEQEKILDNVNARCVCLHYMLDASLRLYRSQQLFDTLNDLKNGEATKHMIKDVRGKGLMIG
jgi:4-aminobutyrate aminotransferase-like enzyme